MSCRLNRPVKQLRNFDRRKAYRTVAKRLQWLLEFEQSTEFSFARWAWEERKLYAFIAKRSLEIDHFYWHFMSDVDIRIKEPAYAQIQREGVEALIQDLNAGKSEAAASRT